MSEHDQICGLLADVIKEQFRTTEAITMLAEALAGIRAAGAIKAEASTAIAKAAKKKPAEGAPVIDEAPLPAPAPAPTADPKPEADPAADKAKLVTLSKVIGVAKIKELVAAHGAKFETLADDVRATILATAEQLAAEVAAK